MPLVVFASGLNNVYTSFVSFRVGEGTRIKELGVKTTFLDNTKLTLIAEDSLGNEDKGINGSYPVEINGFEHNLVFILGRSQCPGNLKNSTFLSLKPQSGSLTKPNIFLLVQWGGGIYPQKISSFWLLAVPIGLIFLGYLFRKMIIFLIVLVFLFFFFNKGLDPITYLKHIYDWLSFHMHL